MKVVPSGNGLLGLDTAVDRFSNRHSETSSLLGAPPLYADLIPLTAPLPGEQYAFEVDLDRCTGCKACVVACHSLNGLGETEWWREVGTLTGEDEGHPWLQTITSACHHCLDPACAEGCPVRAYEKDSVTGIVRHLDDQCIGCRYCEMKCPYGVPKYRADLGIVRKCDLCVGRLEAGEAPACVQACPGGAIRVRKVRVDDIRLQDPEDRMVPTAFPSGYTRPTTRYTSSKPVAENASEVGGETVRAEDAHLPLVWMLALTQLALGIEVSACVATAVGMGALARTMELWALLFLVCGLAGAGLHLGRPAGAWRFFLGLGTSWMSREILAFTVAVPALAASAGLSRFTEHADWVRALACLFLAVAVWTSAMIYIDTRRPGWSHHAVLGDFLGNGVLPGAVLAMALAGFSNADLAAAPPMRWVGLGLLAGAAFWTCWVTLRLPDGVRRFRERLFPHASRIDGALLGCGALMLWCTVRSDSSMIFRVLLVFSLVGLTIWKRTVFFAGTPAPRMPVGGDRC